MRLDAEDVGAGKRMEAESRSMQELATERLDRAAARAAPVRRRRASGTKRIYHKIREEILCLKLRPGEPFDEVGLSKRFKLSRSPVREALIGLAGERLVKLLPNRSAIVAPLDVETLPSAPAHGAASST